MPPEKEMQAEDVRPESSPGGEGEGEGAPAEPGPVPYDRFKEVNEAAKKAQAEAERLARELEGVKGKMPDVEKLLAMLEQKDEGVGDEFDDPEIKQLAGKLSSIEQMVKQHDQIQRELAEERLTRKAEAVVETAGIPRDFEVVHEAARMMAGAMLSTGTDPQEWASKLSKELEAVGKRAVDAYVEAKRKESATKAPEGAAPTAAGEGRADLETSKGRIAAVVSQLRRGAAAEG